MENENNSSDNKDELDEFIVDENEPLDKKLLASIIKPYVNSIGKNGLVDYSEKFEKLPAWKRILIYLCCRKVMFIKNIISEEAAGPKEISEKTIMSEDSARNISRDKNLKSLVSGNKGKYIIPNHKLRKVGEILIEYGKDN